MFPIPLSFITILLTYEISLKELTALFYFDRFNRLSLRPIHGYRTITNRGEINGT